MAEQSFISVDILADPSQAEAAIRGFRRQVEETESAIRRTGKGTSLGEDFAREVDRVQRQTVALQRSFQGLRAPQFGGQFAVQSQQAEARLIALRRTMEALQRQANTPLSAQAFDAYTKSAKRAQDELEKLQRTQSRLEGESLGGGRGAARRGVGASGRGGSLVRDFAPNVLGEVGLGRLGGLAGAGGAAAAGGVVVAGAVFAAKAAIDAGRELERSNRLIASSAKEAGLSYDGLTKKAEAFARLTGQTKTAGQESFAEITRLAQVAGRTGQIDQISESFANLGAARGLKGDELATIARQILAGEDEGINKLGLPNPSKIYEEYAKAIGTTTDKLTQQQQVQSLLDAVMRKSALFDGSAAAQLRTADGQLTQFTSHLKDGLASAGQSGLEALKPVLYELNAIAANIKERGAFGALGEITTLGIAGAIRTDQQRADDAELDKWKKIHADKLKVYQDYSKKLEDLAKQSAETRSFIEADKGGQLGTFLRQDPLAANVDRSKLSKDELEFRDQFQKQQEGYRRQNEQQEAEARRKQEEERRKAESAEAARQTKLRGYLKEAESDVKRLAVELNKDNPFVGLFQKAAEAARDYVKNIGQVGEAQAAVLFEMNRRVIAQDVLGARIDAGLSVLRARQEIERLSVRSAFELSTIEEKRVNLIKQQIAGYAEVQGLMRQALALENSNRRNPQDFLGQAAQRDAKVKEFQELKSGLESAQGISGEYGAQIRSALNAQLRTLFGQLDPNEQAAIYRDATPLAREARGVFAGAFRGGVADKQRETNRQLEEIRNGERAQNDVRAQIAEVERIKRLAGGKLQPEATLEADKRILAISSGIDPRDQSPDIKRARIEALDRTGTREAAKEKEAAAQMKDIADFLKTVKTQLEGNGLKVNTDDVAFKVEVVDPKAGATKMLSAQPTMQSDPQGDRDRGWNY